ncbi:conserved hypothetical protein [Neospora caninum Liverpool]|uniref:Uncharacterized protein n=1 Tax=Neospora caninum (strain Liverpool) TaxID=572307 RepID=F0VHJ7_NEOCL|nr:conserved hypothetical protein [Neospora caninum Liverpool]CBZ53191.1 conserved hypothetical protein [Neospora caninum Liverpool]CEL67181.1 TPA: hypothetical protein BN1204_029790 [Neospora caninum Liverpool]|eukprot:XP_003883223.1 conserved hypothetical protein [Neospora caninum Liverpool]
MTRDCRDDFPRETRRPFSGRSTCSTCSSDSLPVSSSSPSSSAPRSPFSSCQSACLHNRGVVSGATEKIGRKHISRVLFPLIVLYVVYVHLSPVPVADNKKDRGGTDENPPGFYGRRNSRLSNRFAERTQFELQNDNSNTQRKIRRQAETKNVPLVHWKGHSSCTDTLEWGGRGYLPNFLFAAASPHSSFVGTGVSPFSPTRSTHIRTKPPWPVHARSMQVKRRPHLLATLPVLSLFPPSPTSCRSPCSARHLDGNKASTNLPPSGSASVAQNVASTRKSSARSPRSSSSSSFLLCSPSSTTCSFFSESLGPSSRSSKCSSAPLERSSSCSRSSSPSACVEETAQKPPLRVILRTATGCPELDFSLHFDLPFDATVDDLRRALQLRLREEENRLIATLANLDRVQLSESAESGSERHELIGTSRNPQESHRRSSPLWSAPSSASSSVSPLSGSCGPPLSLLRLLYGGACVEDPTVRLSSLLPTSRSEESIRLGARETEEAPQPLVFLLDLPVPPLVLPTDATSSQNGTPVAVESSGSSCVASPSLASSSLSSREDLAAAQTGAVREIVDVVLRLQEARLSLAKKVPGSTSLPRSSGSSPAAALSEALWGEPGLPLQSSENVQRRIAELKRAAASRRLSLETASLSSLSPSPLASPPCAPAASSSSSSSSTCACPAKLIEFPRLAPTLGQRLKQVGRLTFDVDWPWIGRVTCVSFVLQFLLGSFASARFRGGPLEGHVGAAGVGDDISGRSDAPEKKGSATVAGGGGEKETSSHVRWGGWTRAWVQSLEENVFNRDSTYWRRRILLGAAPALILYGWRPVRFFRKLVWHALPRGRWWTALSPLLTASQTAMLVVNEEKVVQMLAVEHGSEPNFDCAASDYDTSSAGMSKKKV